MKITFLLVISFVHLYTCFLDMFTGCSDASFKIDSTRVRLIEAKSVVRHFIACLFRLFQDMHGSRWLQTMPILWEHWSWRIPCVRSAPSTIWLVWSRPELRRRWGTVLAQVQYSYYRDAQRAAYNLAALL